MAKSKSTFKYIENPEGILPCPFCGNFSKKKQNHLAKLTDKSGFVSIHCDGCGCNPNFCVTSFEEAIKKWNSRVDYSEDSQFLAGAEYFRRFVMDYLEEC